MKRRSLKWGALSLLLMAGVLAGCTPAQNNATTTADGEQTGGEITAAFMSSPENYDSDHPQADWTVTAVTNHVYEGLFEMDKDMKAQPHLAEGYEIADNGNTYVINLRKDVKFSDGTAMTADDVVASMERWLKVNEAGVSIQELLDSVEKVDDHTVKVSLNEPYAPFIATIASPVSRQKLTIKKKEIIDRFGEDIITEHIGTGPYVFSNIVLGQKVVLERNENYTPASGELSGLAGKREAILDKVTIEFVPEESVRIAGLQSGQYDFVDEVSTERFDELEAMPNVTPVPCSFGTINVIAFNSGRAPFSEKAVRQAVAYAVDNAEMAKAQIGDDRFWSVEDGSWFKEGSFWYDDQAGVGIFDARDNEKAKELLAGSSYTSDQKLVLLGVKEDKFQSNGLLVLQNKLKEIGIESELQLVDKATFGEYRKNGSWDIVISRWSDMNPDPQVFGPWTGTNGWITNWDDAESKEMDEIFDRMITEMDETKRVEIVKEFNAKFWDTVPYLKGFNDKRLNGLSDKLKGYQSYGQPYFWNVSKDQ